MSGNARRFLVRFSYIGTNYRGSQKQTNSTLLDIDSIQGAVESAIYKACPPLSRPPNLVIAGRTDAGVHALSMTAHIDLERKNGGIIDKEISIRMMNKYLITSGHQIRIHAFYQVHDEFHARYSATNREYIYRFLVSKEPNFHQVPIVEMDRSMHLHCESFDLDRFKRGLELFKGFHDFTTFASRVDVTPIGDYYFKSHIRDLKKCCMEEAKPLVPDDLLSDHYSYYHVFFGSKGFLYKQIRRIMGVLFAMAAKKIDEKDIKRLLLVPNHSSYRYTPAPPHGLYLKTVDYNEKDIKEFFEE